MAYAAGLDDDLPSYFDTRRPDGPLVHPLFPVCPEWEPQLAAWRTAGLDQEELRRVVHYRHDLTLHQVQRTSARITVRPVVVEMRRHRAGTLVVTMFEAKTGDGAPAWTTFSTALARDVELVGADSSAISPAPLPESPGGASDTVARALLYGAAHVYTEASRIWNPIHTDLAVAEAAGLPGTILHGTATLAHAVSVALDRGGDYPTRVRRIAGQFSAMVRPPCTLWVTLTSPGSADGSDLRAFTVRTDDDQLAIRNGLIALGDPPS